MIFAEAKGSKHRSPFLHVSTTFHGAQRFRLMGMARRGESTKTKMVRIDLLKLHVEGALSQHDLIDLSTSKAQHAFFRKGRDGYGDYVESNFKSLDLALNSKEVFLKWRGTIPTSAMQVFFFSITGLAWNGSCSTS